MRGSESCTGAGGGGQGDEEEEVEVGLGVLRDCVVVHKHACTASAMKQYLRQAWVLRNRVRGLKETN